MVNVRVVDVMIVYDDCRRRFNDRPGLRRWQANGRTLHRCNYSFANSLLVHGNDVVNLQLAFDAVGLNVIQDYAVADAAIGHLNDVRNRSATTHGLSLNDLSLLIDLFAIAIFASYLLILRVAQQASGNCTNYAADSDSFGCFIVLMTDDAANDSSCNCTSGCPVASATLRCSSRAQHAAHDEN